MLRARLTNGNFLLGIDAENVRRMREGKPIVVDLTPMGGTDQILIMYGDTQADIARELEELTGQALPVPMPWPENTGGKPS